VFRAPVGSRGSHRVGTGRRFATLADDAERSSSVAGHVPADAALDRCRMLRDHGGRPALSVTRVCRAQAAAHGDGGGQPDAAVHAGVGCAGRIRWRQAAQRSRGARCGGHPGQPARLAVTAANEQDRAQVEKLINQNIPPTQPSVITASSDKRTAAEDHQRPSAEPVRQSPRK
jgi:hypothetical protein